MANRNTYKYELTRGNRVVYVGITNDPSRREAEHRQDKDFTGQTEMPVHLLKFESWNVKAHA